MSRSGGSTAGAQHPGPKAWPLRYGWTIQYFRWLRPAVGSTSDRTDSVRGSVADAWGDSQLRRRRCDPSRYRRGSQPAPRIASRPFGLGVTRMPKLSPASKCYAQAQRVPEPPAKSLALSWSQLHCSRSQSSSLTEKAGAEVKTRYGPQWVRHGYSLALQERPVFAARADTRFTPEKCQNLPFAQSRTDVARRAQRPGISQSIACARSALISSGFSRPTEKRNIPSAAQSE
jgi:hypothetical protein